MHDGEVAFVVDPQRDIDRVLALLDEHGVRLTHVFETHIHNDYVTGGLALAQRTGADYLVNGEDDVSFTRTPLADGEVVEVGGRMRVTALATPGHTFTHLSYALTDTGARLDQRSASSPAARCCTARPAARTSSVPTTPTTWSATSTRRPTGSPSCCPTTRRSSRPTASARSARRPSRTRPRRRSARRSRPTPCSPRTRRPTSTSCWPASARGRPTTPTWPRPTPPGPPSPTSPPPAVADAAELRRRIEAGEWVVDLRSRTAFAAGHAPGTLNFGLDGGFATYLGWLVAWGTPITLLGETAEDVAEAQRELVRIGIDRPAAHATGKPEDWSDRELSSFATATFADLAQVRHHREVVVLDVRRADEHDAARIDGAVNIPLHELRDRLADVPAGEVWVHCAGGYRASVAASFLDAAGRSLVAVDDSFDNAEKVGLHLVGPEA